MREHQLYLKRSKCSFAQDKLEYLRHIISAQGVATDSTKTQAMVDWPRPTTITELRGFLGVTGYYRKFVKGYGVLAKPLTRLLQKKQFEWTTMAQQAFNTLKAAMIHTPVLAFFSKALGEAHKHLSIYEKEFLALIMAVERWRQYLQWHDFVIRTDHKSLSYLNEQNLHPDLQRKAMTRLMGLKFKIYYRKGKENLAADAPSRVGHLMALEAVSEVQP